MNSLSWMIYLASVVDNIGVIFGIMLVVGGLGLIFTTIPFLADHDEYGERLRRPLRNGIVAWIAVALLGSFLPSKETIYAIAASEYGEDILNSETGGKAVQALNAWLDRQIAGEAEDK
jgi:hypothetical protein